MDLLIHRERNYVSSLHISFLFFLYSFPIGLYYEIHLGIFIMFIYSTNEGKSCLMQVTLRRKIHGFVLS
jgi:hypothetical protein